MLLIPFHGDRRFVRIAARDGFFQFPQPWPDLQALLSDLVAHDIHMNSFLERKTERWNAVVEKDRPDLKTRLTEQDEIAAVTHYCLAAIELGLALERGCRQAAFLVELMRTDLQVAGIARDQIPRVRR